MKIIRAYPPNFAQIARAFPAVKGRTGILYAYGQTIYNPSGIVVSPWLLAHEKVHSYRQCSPGDPETWWDLYINNPAFRYDEELMAHRREYREYAKYHTPADTEKYLVFISQRLASRLYGSMTSEQEARDAITGACVDGRPGPKLPGREDVA
jgi:hypothetical protein